MSEKGVFLQRLFCLEEDFYYKRLTKEKLQQFTNTFSQIIEHYAMDIDLRNYFINKMQFLYSSPEVLRILVQINKQPDKHRSTCRNTVRMIEQINLSNPVEMSIEHKIDRTQFQRKFQQAVKIKLFTDFERIKNDEIKALVEQYRFYKNQENRLIETVDCQIDHQLKNINDRLRIRKQNLSLRTDSKDSQGEERVKQRRK